MTSLLRKLFGPRPVAHGPRYSADAESFSLRQPDPDNPRTPDDFDWDRAEYSCLCDDDSCEACRQLEGLTVKRGDPRYYQYEPPHKHCTSPEGCRCVWVLISKRETPSAAQQSAMSLPRPSQPQRSVRRY